MRSTPQPATAVARTIKASQNENECNRRRSTAARIKLQVDVHQVHLRQELDLPPRQGGLHAELASGDDVELLAHLGGEHPIDGAQGLLQDAPAPELLLDPRRSVAALRFSVNSENLLLELAIFPVPLRLLAALPAVVTAPAHPEGAAQATNRMRALETVDGLVSQGRRSEKIANALFLKCPALPGPRAAPAATG